jgi:hypothetical protein
VIGIAQIDTGRSFPAITLEHTRPGGHAPTPSVMLQIGVQVES